jgi:hypothetical protein
MLSTTAPFYATMTTNLYSTSVLNITYAAFSRAWAIHNWLMGTVYSLLSMTWMVEGTEIINKYNIGKVYSLEYTEIRRALFTSHYRGWHQHGNKGSNECSNGIQGHYWNNINKATVDEMFPNNSLCSHCCNNILQQWPHYTLLQPEQWKYRGAQT